jgi:transketolase
VARGDVQPPGARGRRSRDLRAGERRRHDGGLSSEAGSLAGTLGLGRLNVVYDANHVTLAATTDLTFREDVGARFAAFGWHVQEIDGGDVDAVEAALSAARAVEDRPSLIVAHTHIGAGSPAKQDTFQAHGEPLGADEVRATKRALGWPEHESFYVPDEAREVFLASGTRGAAREAAWQARVKAHAEAFPDLGPAFARVLSDRCRTAGTRRCRCTRRKTGTWPHATPVAGRSTPSPA